MRAARATQGQCSAASDAWGGRARRALAQVLLGLESGKHIEHGCVRYIKAHAFRLEPGAASDGGGGLLVTDGELAAAADEGLAAARRCPMRYAPVECVVRAGAARVMSRPHHHR